MELFDSPANALTFAFCFTSQQYPVSPMGKLLKGSNIGSGKGLGGIDGSAQAGLIRAAVERLSSVERSCIVARYSAKTEPCACGKACCAGERTIDEYRTALAALRDWSFSTAPAGIDRPTREAILLAYFDKGVSLAREFERRKVARATGYDAKKRIWDALKTLETDAQNKITEELSWLFAEAA